MSLALDATVLILLQEQRGQHLGVRTLADRMQVDDLVVEESLDRLEPGGGLQVRRVAGMPFSAAALNKDGTCA